MLFLISRNGDENADIPEIRLDSRASSIEPYSDGSEYELSDVDIANMEAEDDDEPVRKYPHAKDKERLDLR